MRPVGVAAAADQRIVGVALRAVAVEHELADRVELALVLPRPRRAHALQEREPGEPCRPADHPELARALDQPERVESGREVADLEEGEPLVEELHESALARRASVEGVGGEIGDVAQGQVPAHRFPLGRSERRVEHAFAAAQVSPLDLFGQEIRADDRVDA